MLFTERLQLRPVTEDDRVRFVALFADPEFMAFSERGGLDPEAANRRFDRMLAVGVELSFGKQAIVDPSTGSIIGYTGAGHFEFRGRDRLEFGYRLVPEARGRGLATEAAAALLERAGQTWHGDDLLAFIDPHNQPSRRVLDKLGFEFVEDPVIRGGDAELYRLAL